MAAGFPDPLKHEFSEWVLHDDYFYYAKDIVSFGNALTIENLREAYLRGIFPWHIDGIPLPWYCPSRRAVLFFDDIHVSRSLERAKKKAPFTFTIDRNFRAVIEACSDSKRSGQKGTWITNEFIEAYSELHLTGMAHSVEAWNAEGELVGGLYGVDADGVFCGESMFYRVPNASKLALLFLIDHLRSRGSSWFDCQVMTPHMKALGAKEIGRKLFLARLADAQKRTGPIFSR